MINLVEKEQSNYLLTPENSALILLAHQTSILLETNQGLRAELKENFLALAAMAKIFNLPTVVSGNDNSQYSRQLTKEIIEIRPHTEIVNRPSLINAWQDSKFQTAVKNTKRSKLILAGLVTDICLAFTAISAVKEKYEVYIITDVSENFYNKESQTVVNSVMDRTIQAGCKITKRVAVAAELKQSVKEQKEMKRTTELKLGKLFQDISSPVA